MKSRVLKTIISVVLAFMVFVLCMPVALAAETSGACGDNAKWSYDSATKCLTISGAGDMYDDVSPWEDYYISSVIIEKGITRIGAHAFEDTSVFYAIIPEGVTTIGAYAFSSTPLFEVMIPASVRMIEEGAFDCETDVALNVNYGGTAADWENMDSDSYNDDLFSAALKTDASMNELKGSFGDNANWTFYIHSRTLRIEGSGDMMTFYDSYGNLTLGSPDGNYLSDEWRLYYLITSSGLVENVQVCDGITSVGMGCFANFDEKASIKSVELANTVETIEDYAFLNQSNLEKVSFGSSVYLIDHNAFGGSFDSLADIYYGGTEDDWNSIRFGQGNDSLSGATVHYGSSVEIEPPSEYDSENNDVVTYGEDDVESEPESAGLDKEVLIVAMIAGTAVILAVIVAIVIIVLKKKK